MNSDLIPREQRVISASEILTTMIPNMLAKSLGIQASLLELAKAQMIGATNVPADISELVKMAEDQAQEYRNAITLYNEMMGFKDGEAPRGHREA